jgi:formylglycine-generating enzyme required for sulfatase activity
VSLFNGKDLTGWVVESGDPKAWEVVDGEIVAKGVNSSQARLQNYLLTERDYSDFILRLEFTLERVANTAVAVRALPGETVSGGQAAHPTMNLQCGTGHSTGQHHWIKDGKMWSPPNEEALLKPSGEWNLLEMEVRGQTLRASVNGKLVLEIELDAFAKGGEIKPGLSRTKGRIGLLRHTGTVHFRKIEIKELPTTKTEPDKDLAGWVDEKWIREVSALPVEQQVAAVRATLQERNPGFDGAVKHQSEGGVVTEFNFNGSAVHDLSPLLAFSGLQKLDCSCKDPWQSPLSDLSPLSRLPLRSLRYPYHTGLGAEPLRSIKTLQTVNDQPAAAFWKGVAAEAEEFAKFEKMVAALTPQAQQNAVANRLKDRNPGFDGKVTATVEGSVVTGLKFVSDQVTDLSPVRALTGLRTLQCSGSDQGKNQLADLSPLKDMKLTWLNCEGTQVSDLSPLKGMPLTYLKCHRTRVSDLSPLKDMKLTELHCWGTPVSDLSPLKDMKLTSLNCAGTGVSDLSPLKDMKLTWLDCQGTRVSDLSPLKGMPLTLLFCLATKVSDLSPLKDTKLTSLNCSYTPVSDLSPLKDMKLTDLNCAGTGVSDLSPLKDMKLTYLKCDHTRVSDLAPLKGMSLKEVHCDFKPERDAEILRSIKTLEKIDGKPAAQFWKEVPPAPKQSGQLPPSPSSLPQTQTVDLGDGVKMDFALIPKGKFMMGSPQEEKGRNPWEKNFDAEQQHEVEISKPFYLAKYPVTQEQYQTIMKKNPSWFQAGNGGADKVKGLDTKQFPVEQVSWNDAQAFCRKMRDNDKQGRKFRLPTEAEWEYACRAGTTTPFYFGSVLDGTQANCDGNYPYGTDVKGPYKERTTKVGDYGENKWGLCDMHGNVWQWCEDYYGPYEVLNTKDPLRSIKHSEERRVLRGGSWRFGASVCRAACHNRNNGAPDIADNVRGFRVAFSTE